MQLKYLLCFPLLFFFCSPCLVNGQNGILKYVVYDFDGLNTGQTNLPDGDFFNGDLTFAVAADPLQASDVIGDRALRLNLNWQGGAGEFGKATMRFLDLDKTTDRFNFYIYNPVSNSGAASLQLIITEDDNNNNTFEDASDDKWVHSVTVPVSGSWQLVSVPLSSFTDGNTGGNGDFDARYNSPGGMLFSVGILFSRPSPSSVTDVYYIDMLSFSDGNMPVGNSVTDLPAPAHTQGCALGALTSNNAPETAPNEVHSYLPPGKKISYVNWFMFYSTTGTTASMLPGNEVQTLIDNGYQPIITWEMMHQAYGRLAPEQPRLDKIIDGTFDGYIDAFANKVKSYTGPVIMRIFHEFEGDWYSWSLTHNGNSAATYISAYRHVVDRFRAAGASNVRWMWCLNAEPKPYVQYNYVVNAYPGDNYVDIVATDIYNHPDLGEPDWKSFRYTMAETYYYLVKHYSHKPLFICEVGCRERGSSEPAASQTKAGWLCQMNKDLRSYFSKTQALVFFSTQKEHDWRINSSDAAKQAFVNCFWNDAWYGSAVSVEKQPESFTFSAWPNPFTDQFKLLMAGLPDTGQNAWLTLFDINGKRVYTIEGRTLPAVVEPSPEIPEGIYIVEIKSGSFVIRRKLIKAPAR